MHEILDEKKPQLPLAVAGAIRLPRIYKCSRSIMGLKLCWLCISLCTDCRKLLTLDLFPAIHLCSLSPDCLRRLLSRSGCPWWGVSTLCRLRQPEAIRISQSWYDSLTRIRKRNEVMAYPLARLWQERSLSDKGIRLSRLLFTGGIKLLPRCVKGVKLFLPLNTENGEVLSGYLLKIIIKKFVRASVGPIAVFHGL